MDTEQRTTTKQTAIYTVITDDGVYGGKTTDIKTRFRCHRRRWPNCHITIDTWLPVGVDWVDAERQHIATLRASGLVILNKNDGGGGPVQGSEESRAKQSLASRGKSKSAEHRANISKGLLGNKNGKGLPVGRKHTEEHRANISAAVRGHSQSLEWVAKRVTSRLATLETKKNA